MPVCCAVCLFSLQVFGLVNILVMTLVCRVRIFQRSVEQVHSGLVARIQEAVHEELDSEKKLTEEQRGIRGWLVGRRMTEEASIDGVELKERNMSRGDSFVQQRALEYDERFQRAQKVQRIVEVHSATAPYAELHHEAYVLLREIMLASSEFDWILGMLLVVCTVVVLLTCLSVFTEAAHHSLTGWKQLHYLSRDIFNITVALAAIHCTILVTSQLTTSCNECVDRIINLDVCDFQTPSKPRLPLLDTHQRLVNYLQNDNFRGSFGFTIFDTKVERNHLATFMYTMVSLLMCIFFELGFLKWGV